MMKFQPGPFLILMIVCLCGLPVNCVSNENNIGSDGLCSDNAACSSSGQYCRKATGECEGEGVCTSKPENCFAVIAYVCGCDGSTYGNECDAARKGISVAHQGKCGTQ